MVRNFGGANSVRDLTTVVEGVMLPFAGNHGDPSTSEDINTNEDITTSDGSTLTASRRSRRKAAEPSGVPMPGIRGLPVVERVLRPRNTRNREDTMDG